MAKGCEGMVMRVTGPVVDILFAADEIPDIFHAITIENNSHTFVLEVSQHLGNGMVRCISMHPTDGLSRGLKAVDTGKCIEISVGKETLGRMVNVLGSPIDNGEEIKTYTLGEFLPLSFKL
jgi:F-type H+-transporting ATPase subunit beta